MEKKKKMSGCAIAALIGAAVLLGGIALVAFVLFGYLNARKTESMQKMELAQLAAERDMGIATMAEDGRLFFDEADLPEFEPLKPGDAVSRDQFLISTVDSTSTALARENFRQQADGAPVEWSMKLMDVSSAQVGSLVADFEIAYGIRRFGGTEMYSQLQVEAEFDKSQRDALLRLRRGHWVTVNGTLSLAGGKPRIVKAKVVERDASKDQ